MLQLDEEDGSHFYRSEFAVQTQQLHMYILSMYINLHI